MERGVFFLIVFACHIYSPAFGQAVVTVVPSPPPGTCLRVFISERVQHSQTLVDFNRILLTHALALHGGVVFVGIHACGFVVVINLCGWVAGMET